MKKTSVYLPDHLKRALRARAAATRRSEAEVLRAAVEAAVSDPTGVLGAPGAAGGVGPAAAGSSSPGSPAPGAPAVGALSGSGASGGRVERPQPGRLVGVGVGPGDPDLLTVRALVALRRADRVLAPATAPDAVGRAETIVRQAAPDVRVERVPFVMHPDVEARATAMGEVAATVAGHLEAGDEVAFITLGDPLTYSTFSALAAAVEARRPGTAVEVVPGIMAFQSLAARTRTTLVDERQRLTVRTALDGDDLSAGDLGLDDPDCTVVLYKGGRHLPELAEAARTAGRSDAAVAGELLGMTGERVGRLDDLATGPASYLATVIVPAHPARPARPDRPDRPAGSGGSRGRRETGEHGERGEHGETGGHDDRGGDGGSDAGGTGR